MENKIHKQKRAIFSNIFYNISISGRQIFINRFSSMINNFLEECPDILGNSSLTLSNFEDIDKYTICISNDEYPDIHLDIVIRFRQSNYIDEIETLVINDDFHYHELTCDSLAWAQDKIGDAVEKFLGKYEENINGMLL